MNASPFWFRDTLASAWRLRMDILGAADDPITRQRLLAVLDAALDDSIDYITRAAMWERASSASATDPVRQQLRAYVKVDGVYPSEMSSFSRYKDRMYMTIDQVLPVPRHSISVEMIPILREFRGLSDRLDLERLALRRERRCTARLMRAGRVVAHCHLEHGHTGEHVEIGSTEELDNWPPRATVRWADDVQDLRPYHHSKPGTWRWTEDEELPLPEYTGVKRSSVKRLRGDYKIRDRRIRWRVRLPDSFDYFLLRSRRTPPLYVFGVWLAAELGGLREGWALDVSEIHLIKSDFEALTQRERFWWARRGSESEANWTILDQSPNEVGNGDHPVPDFVLPGSVYIGEKVFVRRDRGRPGRSAQSRTQHSGSGGTDG